ncbi:hypothetical protein HAX54_035353 [Datura stramonium]|uniref:NB-ARC domain-containing protein n=1 Tax=Datura stramonium TaxID=4076 RepID=A0ABS8VG19_DATST|nr:hypothetical protein [Datura stramonium]
MEGEGKTTLAKHIHIRLLEETHYRVHWVTVSLEFSIKRLQGDLAKIMNLDLENDEDEHRRAAKLNRAFRERKNMLQYWMMSWFVLAWRSWTDCQEILKVEELNTDDAWELFRKNSLGYEIVLSPSIKTIVKSMAGRCEGLSVRLITLG